MVASLLSMPAAASAAAQPPGNANWITVTGTCDGRPAVMNDPPGPGPTAFESGGSVVVGKIFTFYDVETGQFLLEELHGRGIDAQRLVTCVFIFEDVPDVPGLPGLRDIRFVVQGLVTPRGS